jgi:hypothetical protein
MHFALFLSAQSHQLCPQTQSHCKYVFPTTTTTATPLGPIRLIGDFGGRGESVPLFHVCL